MRTAGLTPEHRIAYSAGKLKAIAEHCMNEARRYSSQESKIQFVSLARDSNRKAWKLLRDIREPWPELQAQIDRILRFPVERTAYLGGL